MSRKKYKCGAKVLDIYIINYCIYTQYLHIKLLHRYVYNTLHIICIETMSLNPCLVSSGRYSAGCTVQGTAGVVYQLLHSVHCTSHHSLALVTV